MVGITGGSGLIYAQDLLEALRHTDLETHLIITAGAKQVIPTELEETALDLERLATVVHKDNNLGASIASGSFLTLGMVIVPCSAGTLAKVATGFSDNLVSRAAQVTLKERRSLVLVVREAPYSRPMLVNMLAANDAGATIVPAAPGFYHRPKTLSELVGSITSRTLDLFGIDNNRVKRWKEDE
ncbi:MAG: UbiX family flavin prenyltransferase [Trueperaceae bacterium]|nr:MAG: UbiX family flavin prenyltransferase [Trueperaceae bacterium]